MQLPGFRHQKSGIISMVFTPGRWNAHGYSIVAMIPSKVACMLDHTACTLKIAIWRGSQLDTPKRYAGAESAA